MVLNRLHHVELGAYGYHDAMYSTRRPSSDIGLAGSQSRRRDVDRERSSTTIAQDQTIKR